MDIFIFWSNWGSIEHIPLVRKLHRKPAVIWGWKRRFWTVTRSSVYPGKTKWAKVWIGDPSRIQRKCWNVQNLPTQHIKCFFLHWPGGKREIWWGALEQRFEWQNDPKAPASSNEAAWCSNQVHWAQEGPDVARTLTRSFQHSQHSPLSPSAATKHSQYLATGKETDTLCTWIIIAPLVNWRFFF